jgi:ribosomal protein L12E/L44/L45/RPP1/RPP2
MRIKGLLVAALVLAALSGALYWSNRKQKAEESKPAAETPKIVKMEANDVQKVELKRKDGQVVVVERGRDNQWTITAPKPLRADQETTGSLVSTLASLSSDKVVDEKPADLSQFGFNTPSLEVTITKKDGKTAKILVGDDAPTGGGAFVKTTDDPKVYTVASYNKSSFDKTANDLRDKRLMTFENDKLTRVEVSSKGRSVEFGKNAKGDWAILKPKPMRADGIQVDELIRRLRDAKMDASVSDEDAKKAAAAFSGGTLIATAKVADNAGTQQLEVRKSKEDYYARSSVVEGAYKVTSELGSGLDKKVDDFRNKKVFDFGFNDVTKLGIHDGAKAVQFEKSGEKWKSGAQEMDSVGVQSLIDKLREASATKFLDSGFPAATFDATLTYGNSAEKVLFAKSGDKTLARRDNEPTVYELEGKTLDELQKAVSDVKPAQPPKEAKKK